MRWGMASLGCIVLMTLLCSLRTSNAAEDEITEDTYTFPVLVDEEKIVRRELKYADGKTNLTVGAPLNQDLNQSGLHCNILEENVVQGCDKSVSATTEA